MALGWKRLLPLALAGFVANAVFVFCAQTILLFLFFLCVSEPIFSASYGKSLNAKTLILSP